jgi:2-hydroxy-6-oxonona-2,4-dienedioate hydrolase
MPASWKGLLDRVRPKKYGRKHSLILLNGLAEQAESWYRNARFWGRFFDVHMPSLMAYEGDSLHRRIRSGEPVTVEYLVDQLHTYVDQFVQTPPYHLVASSLGGKVAVEFAARYPQLVNRIVLLCPSGMGDRERLPILDSGRVNDYEKIVRSVFYRPRKADRTMLNYYRRCFQSRKWKLGLIRTVKGTNDHLVRPLMKQIQNTTLLIGAKEDQIVDHLEGERAAVEMPNGHWLSLPRCGHAPQIEMPRLINRLVVHFLTSPNPSAQPNFVKLLLNKPSRVLV